jgi:hypothetical protein
MKLPAVVIVDAAAKKPNAGVPALEIVNQRKDM